jgi:phosphoheptose isomerase
MTSQSQRLSLAMQDIANGLNEYLKVIAGEEIAFVLIIQADKVAQYVSNASRADGTELIEDLLNRWKANRADIPAHYNPDLRPPQAG